MIGRQSAIQLGRKSSQAEANQALSSEQINNDDDVIRFVVVLLHIPRRPISAEPIFLFVSNAISDLQLLKDSFFSVFIRSFEAKNEERHHLAEFDQFEQFLLFLIHFPSHSFKRNPKDESSLVCIRNLQFSLLCWPHTQQWGKKKKSTIGQGLMTS